MLMYEYVRPSRVDYVERGDGGVESGEMHYLVLAHLVKVIVYSMSQKVVP